VEAESRSRRAQVTLLSEVGPTLQRTLETRHIIAVIPATDCITGGRISVDSSGADGTCFSVELPIAGQAAA